MKTAAIFVIPLALAFMAGSLQGDEPELKAGVILQNGGSALWVDRHATPEVVDWDNDGDKDLVVGCFGYGHISLFLNQGTDLNPVFNGSTKLKSGATVITTSYS